MTLPDIVRQHHVDTLAEHARPTWEDGVPNCSLDACPVYDGKRCSAMGCRPSSVCEPAVQALSAVVLRGGK